MRSEDSELILKNGKKQPDISLRDTENVPLTENIQDYFKREVLPFTLYFYKYEAPQPSDEIMAEILELEKELSGNLEEIFGI